MEGVNIPTEKVMQEVVRAQIQNYVNSDEGKSDVRLEISNSVHGVMIEEDCWTKDSLQGMIKSAITDEVMKLLNQKESNNMIREIANLGMKTYLEGRGYEVKRKRK